MSSKKKEEYCLDDKWPIVRECPDCVDKVIEYARLAGKVAELAAVHWEPNSIHRNCLLCAALNDLSNFRYKVQDENPTTV